MTKIRKNNVLALVVLGSILSTSAAVAGTQSDIPLGIITVNPDSQNDVSLSKLQHGFDKNNFMGTQESPVKIYSNDLI